MEISSKTKGGYSKPYVIGLVMVLAANGLIYGYTISVMNSAWSVLDKLNDWGGSTWR